MGRIRQVISAVLVLAGAVSAAVPRTPEDSLRVGFRQLDSGKVEAALPWLLPNLSRLNSEELTGLENRLKNSRHLSAALVVLRHHGSREKEFSPQLADAGELAFRSGQFILCRDLLAPHAGDLDSASAHRFLLAGFYTGGKFPPLTIQRAASRSKFQEVLAAAALNEAFAGNFSHAKAFLSNSTPLPIKGYIKAQELDAAEKTDEAVEYFQQALDSKWPEFHAVVMAEFYKHYALTGNRYKADQLWDAIKGGEEEDTLPAIKELLAFQLGLRGYEKQARYLYRNLYRTYPNRPAALKALWDEMVMDDSAGLGEQIHNLLAADSLDCDANLFAMRFAKAGKKNGDVVRYGSKVMLYCPDVLEPYFDLAGALLETSRPAEARYYFKKYVERGGDLTRVPTYMR